MKIYQNISLIVIIFFSFQFPAFSQYTRLYGKIYDEERKLVPFVNISIKDSTAGTVSNEQGEYSITIPSEKQINLIISFVGFKTQEITINASSKQKFEQNITIYTTSHELPVHTINADKDRNAFDQSINPDNAKIAPTVGGGIEDILKTQAGVSSNNELSSQYSVRGGNFDENLVYVNEIEIYRPFLIRTGQQEGLSFINPYLTSNIYFSAGGFDAKYGDKMSSVLDINYKSPTKNAGSAYGSLLGGGIHFEGISKNKIIQYIVGTRYKTNKYLLNTLPIKGEYDPTFIDVQSLVTFSLSTKSKLELLTNYASNKYDIVPKSSISNFGTTGRNLQLRVFFEGQESYKYATAFGALKYIYKPKDDLQLKLIASAYQSLESEAFDVLGEYFLEEIDPNDNSQKAFNKGVGSFRNHARNDLEATIFNFSHRGKKINEQSSTEWELKYQRELISDNVNQWNLVDSAGFTIPNGNSSEISLQNVAIAKNQVESNRITSFVQQNWRLANNVSINTGIRSQYWSFSNEFLVSPRASVSYKPNWEKDYLFRVSSGLYYQPAYYKEFRNLNGSVNKDIKSQQSAHYVLGADRNFTWGERNFKFMTEVYYKDLKNLIPYQINNVQIVYLPNQLANGYVAGIDFKIHGEFVKGLDSWARLSFLKTEEDIVGDFYIDKSSNRIEPGYIPRPTDQRMNINIFFQDYLPKNPEYKVHLNLVYASGLPFGPGNFLKYQDVLQMPAYRRVDIGFSKQLKSETDVNPTHLLKYFKSSWVSLEVFNLLQTNNTVSYLWIKDAENNRFAVPNFLTSRRLNVKLIFEF